MATNILLYKLTKQKSIYEINIYEDRQMDPDGWFIDIQQNVKKSGKITSRYCIIKKDLQHFLNKYLLDGWEISYSIVNP